jgi:hypothetical protein
MTADIRAYPKKGTDPFRIVVAGFIRPYRERPDKSGHYQRRFPFFG